MSGACETNYILREVAGIYWLIDIAQPGVPYRKPVAVNEMGARIFSMSKEGLSDEEMAEVLVREYEDTDKEEILRDITDFKGMLNVRN